MFVTENISLIVTNHSDPEIWGGWGGEPLIRKFPLKRGQDVVGSVSLCEVYDINNKVYHNFCIFLSKIRIDRVLAVVNCPILFQQSNYNDKLVELTIVTRST